MLVSHPPFCKMLAEVNVFTPELLGEYATVGSFPRQHGYY
jgi:hypothetical protein